MTDQQFMHRAFELACLGQGKVSPNPMVGCVIVHEGRIIGEGYHQIFGGPHAEVNAVNAVKDTSLLPESTAYVTLEPCSHFGKTPPCADLLIKHRVSKVVIANVDPNPKVSGNGIRKLLDAEVEVQTGLLEEMGNEVNKRFFTAYRQNRPFVILKWAQTTDGFVARENFDSKWISNAYSRQLVHKWRSEEDAILVGTNTARYDNPSLTTRDWHGHNPVRIVLDSKLMLNSSLHLFDKSQRTICITTQSKESELNIEYKTVTEMSPANILDILYQENLHSVIIEGGAQVLHRFIESNFWDEARVFISEQTFGKGIAAPVIADETFSVQNVFHDQLRIYHNSSWQKN